MPKTVLGERQGLAAAATQDRAHATEADHEAAIEAARNLLEIEAGRTETRPLTLLVSCGAEKAPTRWLGAWSWDPQERWQAA